LEKRSVTGAVMKSSQSTEIPRFAGVNELLPATAPVASDQRRLLVQDEVVNPVISTSLHQRELNDAITNLEENVQSKVNLQILCHRLRH
jgi:hypothetical protein